MATTSTSSIRALQMPDWREGNPYQQLLADGLSEHGVEAVFPGGRRRGLPIARMLHDAEADVLHLHWPEAFFNRVGSFGDRARLLRFPFDVHLATANAPLVMTAHNLVPHDRQDSRQARTVYRNLYRGAAGVISHTKSGAATLERDYGVSADKIDVIPHGDLLSALPPLPSREVARQQLGLPDDQRVALVFGAIMGYKAIPELITLWKQAAPDARLLIVGKAIEEQALAEINVAAEGRSDIRVEEGFLSDEDLVAHLAASDVAVFNYRKIFASGAATLARSAGLPILLTDRADTVELGEPTPAVIRFANDAESLADDLEQAFQQGWCHDEAAEWRKATSWHRVAGLTATTYQQALASR